MAQISDHISEDFASMFTDSGEKNEVKCFGTLVQIGDDKYVLLDGSEQLTPVTEAMDAEEGDRVSVDVINHSAIVTGNFSNPASSRYASAFIKKVKDGIMVGELDKNGKPTGKYTIMKSDRFAICNKDGKEVAYFTGDAIVLGMDQNASIDLCSGGGNIRYRNGMLVTSGKSSVGIATKNGNINSNVVCEASSGTPAIRMQMYSDDMSKQSVLRLGADHGLTYNGQGILTSGNITINQYEVNNLKMSYTPSTTSDSGGKELIANDIVVEPIDPGYITPPSYEVNINTQYLRPQFGDVYTQHIYFITDYWFDLMDSNGNVVQPGNIDLKRILHGVRINQIRLGLPPATFGQPIYHSLRITPVPSEIYGDVVTGRLTIRIARLTMFDYSNAPGRPGAPIVVPWGGLS